MPSMTSDFKAWTLEFEDWKLGVEAPVTGDPVVKESAGSTSESRLKRDLDTKEAAGVRDALMGVGPGLLLGSDKLLVCCCDSG